MEVAAQTSKTNPTAWYIKLIVALVVAVISMTAGLLLGAEFAHAVQMDETTHDMVIQRLEYGVGSMEKNAPERADILGRLADLYSDRARLKALNEMDKKCDKCTGAAKDRQHAIELYNQTLAQVPKDQQGTVVLQIAHLYQLSDQSNKSRELYEGILKSKKSQYSSEVKSIANASVAEIYFRQNDFKIALKYYEAARKEKLKNRALVEYRIAWCQLNLGQEAQAIATLKHLLNTPSLMITQSTDGKTPDASFKEDATNDLAKFMAHSQISAKDIAFIKHMSSDKTRKNNLYTLASEADRLGKKQEALNVWAAYVDEGDVQPNEKLETQIRVARINYDLNKLDRAATAFEKAMALWKAQPCAGNDDLCTELKTRARAMVTAWNKAEKDRPRQELFRAYMAYIGAFPDDFEVLQWGAVVAKTLGKHKEGAALFHSSALIAKAQLEKKPNDKALAQVLEGSLLGEIEMAEGSDDLKARENAYNFYLQVNPTGAQAFQARYQRAQVYYNSNRFQNAFSEFHYLANMPGHDNRELKMKSADLALDSLVALKDDQNLQTRSLEYAKLFPERKDEFLKISRKASMTIVANNLKNEKENDRGDYKKNLAALNVVNLEGADDAEKIKFYKNKLNVAQKALDLAQVKNSAEHLLKIKTLSKTDREWSFEQEVWVAELQLDFAQAYRLSQEMELPKLPKTDRELRLGMLAELSGQSPRAHNEAYLRLSKTGRSSNLVRISLIKESANPWREIDQNLNYLKSTPDLLAGIALETFARQPDFKRVEGLRKSTRIGQFPAGQTLFRHLEMRDFKEFDKKIAKHRLSRASDKLMQKSIKERLALLAESDKRAQAAIAKHDWTLQLLSLAQVARENRRLYGEILRLPVPRGLNKEEREKYARLLQTQSDPYLARATQIETELARMWSDSYSLQNLQAAYLGASAELQKLYRVEIKDLAQNAPPSAANRLHGLLDTPFRRPSRRDLLNARRDLQQSPFDLAKVESLRQLEAQNGHPAMVVYLDERLNQLKAGKSL